MAFIPSPHGASARLVFKYGTYEWSNILWFTKEGFTSGDQEILANLLLDEFDASGDPYLSQWCTLDRVDVTDGRTEGAQVVSDTQAPVTGTGAVTVAPTNTAVVLTLRTGTRGRSYRGRLYFSGFSEDVIQDNMISESVGAGLLSWIGATKTSASADGWTMVIRSTQHNNQVISPAVMTPVTTFSLRSRIVGSQRRRIPRP